MTSRFFSWLGSLGDISIRRCNICGEPNCPFEKKYRHRRDPDPMPPDVYHNAIAAYNEFDIKRIQDELEKKVYPKIIFNDPEWVPFSKRYNSYNEEPTTKGSQMHRKPKLLKESTRDFIVGVAAISGAAVLTYSFVCGRMGYRMVKPLKTEDGEILFRSITGLIAEAKFPNIVE